MSLNPDLNKQVQEVTFLRKMTKYSHPKICFKNVPLSCVNFQKHSGVKQDEKLDFNYHIFQKMSKAIKGIDAIRKLIMMLSQHSAFTIYKSFARPHPTMVMYFRSENFSSCGKQTIITTIIILQK